MDKRSGISSGKAGMLTSRPKQSGQIEMEYDSALRKAAAALQQEGKILMKRKLMAAMLACVMTVSVVSGCGNTETGADTSETSGTEEGADVQGGAPAAPADAEDLSGTLTFAIWDNNLNDFIEQNDMVGKFQEQYPNVDIEVEKIKDDSEYWNAMKMRASANQLPDVMFNKTFTLARFKDYLIDLSGTEACANNELASGYALDGKVLGIPMTSG